MKTHLVLIAALALAACGSSNPDPGNLPGLKAQKIGTVTGPSGCGIPNAYRVTEAAGVRLTTPARLSRKAATRLDSWLRNHAVPTIGNKGGGLVAIRVAAHYACRTRNNRPGARLSEHARGNAIDISGFILADGSELTVSGDWRGRNRGVMRALHATACGPFGTVLGPNADRFHQDHFHFDVASYRSGSYCR